MRIRLPSLSPFSIRARLALVLAATALIVAVGLFLVFQHSFRSGFVAYLNDSQRASLLELAEVLSDQAPKISDWNKLLKSPAAWRRAVESARDPDGRGSKTRGDKPRRRPGRLTLLTPAGESVFGRPPPDTELMQVPVVVEKQLVAFIGAPVLQQVSHVADRVFLSSQVQLFLLWTLLAMLLAAAFAIPVASYLTRRLQSVSSAVQRLAARDYSVRLNPVINDELGQLAVHVDLCAETLSRYQSQQQRWLVDISHELRTPLSILQAEIEALIDGVRPLSIESLTSLQSEVLMLAGLVDSLHQVSMLEEKAQERVKTMSVREFIGFLQTKLAGVGSGNDASELEVVLSLPPEGATEDRLVSLSLSQLEQIINNLWQNTRRYTDAPGHLQIELSLKPSHVVVEWMDSAPGLSSEQLPLVFDRLWRDEKSRNRALGGSGLGLAICKALVESAGGEIGAAHSPLGGLAIHIKLPLRRPQIAESV